MVNVLATIQIFGLIWLSSTVLLNHPIGQIIIDGSGSTADSKGRKAKFRSIEPYRFKLNKYNFSSARMEKLSAGLEKMTVILLNPKALNKNSLEVMSSLASFAYLRSMLCGQVGLPVLATNLVQPLQYLLVLSLGTCKEKY